jgi:hypothetical protein
VDGVLLQFVAENRSHFSLTTSHFKVWEDSVGELLSAYSEVERRSLLLPAFSLGPWGDWIWNVSKFFGCTFVDVIVLIPGNLFAALRNLFPGKWRYIPLWTWPYIRYIGLWIWRGESPLPPTVIVRAIVSYLLSQHLISRLKVFRRRILLDQTLSWEEKDTLVSRIDKLNEGNKFGILHAFFTFGLPAITPVLAIFQVLYPKALPLWVKPTLIVLITYSLLPIVTAFVVKRGLMLQTQMSFSYLPGSFAMPGVYGLENRIFELHGIVKKEFPLDLLFILVGSALYYFAYMAVNAFYRQVGLPAADPPEWRESVFLYCLVLLICSFAFFRRRKLQRC